MARAKFVGIQTNQGERRLFVGTMKVGDLLKISKVDIWRKEHGKELGYQRVPERQRALAIARYVEEETVLMPLSVLLSYRGRLDKEVIPLEEKFIVIEFDENNPDHILWQVDGQHRLAGFQVAIEEDGNHFLSDFQLPVVIVEGLSPIEEAEQFRVINETAKKVRTDLARRLLVLAAQIHGRSSVIRIGREWEVRATDIVEILVNTPESPWFGRIQRPNEKKNSTHVVRELSFSNSLGRLIKDPFLRRYDPKQIASWLIEFWAAWQELVPEAFEDPKKYVLLKTPGIFSQHYLAGDIFGFCLAEGINIERKEIKGILNNLGEYAKPRYWEADNPEGAAAFGSMKGFSILHELMLEELQSKGYCLT